MTGVGHARLINERFGRFWGWFSVGDLFLLNFLTITTEFIGVTLALAYFGVSKYIAVPIAAIVLVAITTSGSFRRWERAMFFFIATSLVLIPLAFLSHPSYSASVYHLLVPGVQGGVSSDAILFTLATSYAFGDVFGLKHSLHRSFRDAKPFYASCTGTPRSPTRQRVGAYDAPVGCVRPPPHSQKRRLGSLTCRNGPVGTPGTKILDWVNGTRLCATRGCHQVLRVRCASPC